MTLLRQGSCWLGFFGTVASMVMVWFTLPWWASVPASLLFAALAAYCVVTLAFDEVTDAVRR